MENDFSTKEKLKILQITDMHLFSTNPCLFGINPNKNFNEVMRAVFNQEIKDTDFILLTGDLSQDETADSYQYLVESFKHCEKPVFWISGNHDNEKLMTEVFSQLASFKRGKFLELNDWIFLFINSKLEGSENGYLSQDELKELEKKLKLCHKNVALIMHHHPTPVNTPLIDKYILNNREELWEIISNTKVKLIITGHVHGDYTLAKNDIKIECSPATCYQLKKGTSTLEIDHAVGYKIHYFDKSEYYSKAVVWEFS
ncbi:3',5'-cyclic adenosine monophosphate phosphodiesterase CpdA [Legionella nautarum]|uniref:3',5'-cyclic adenosine monophosphate phosphodiesterase CpdA n=1 Tax=Legionella nautarum TaxID=45070 RepID=A0A0W0WV08_9GAMM|nr:metallophosphoesterase [Legionella nautarum]KTD36152.1 3',5'-cyclic adenosine monophosphate phosphodiesterase CpdA [Legionella nautarum]